MLGLIVVALLAFIVPGLLFIRFSGLPWSWALLGAIPVTTALYQFCALFYGAVQIPYSLPWIIAGVIFFLALSLLWGYAWRNSYTPRALSTTLDMLKHRSTRRALLSKYLVPGLGAAAGFGIIIFWGTYALNNVENGIDNVFQGWDSLWHASTLKYIELEGIASPMKMGPLQNTETAKELFYPTGWHCLAAVLQMLTGASITSTLNITSYVLPAVILPLTGLVLGWKIAGTRDKTASYIAGLSAVALTLPLPLFFIGYFVGAWPYLVAICMLGIIVFFFTAVTVRHSAVLIASLSLMGACTMHPSAITVVVIVLILWWLFSYLGNPINALYSGCRTLWNKITGKPVHTQSSVGSMPAAQNKTGRQQEWTDKLIGTLYMLVAAIITVIYLVPQWVSIRDEAEDIEGFNNIQDNTRWEALRVPLYLTTRHADEFGEAWIILIPALIGLILTLFWLKNLWVVLAYAVFAVLVAHSIVPYEGLLGQFMSKVIALHYSMGHRLILPVAMFAGVFVAVALVFGVRLVFAGAWNKTRWTYATLIVVVAVLITATIFSITYQQPAKQKIMKWARDEKLVDQDERDAYEWLAQQPEAYAGHVGNTPGEGSGWMYPLQGIPAMHKHYLWPKVPQDSATNSVYWHVRYVGQGVRPEVAPPGKDPLEMANETDFLADEMNISFYVVSPPEFWNEPMEHGQEFGIWDAPGITPVWKKGKTIIFARNVRFTDEQILHMRSESPEELPPIRFTWGDLGKVPAQDPEADRPYIHRPLDYDPTILTFHYPQDPGYKEKQKLPDKWVPKEKRTGSSS